MKKIEMNSHLRIVLIVFFLVFASILITQTIKSLEVMEIQEASISFDMEFMGWQKRNIEKSIESHEAFLELEKEELKNSPRIKGSVQKSLKMLYYYKELILQKSEYKKFLRKKETQSTTTFYCTLFTLLSSVSMVLALLFAFLTKSK